MRLLAFSDTHVVCRGDVGWQQLEELPLAVEKEQVDVVLFGGDLVEPASRLLGPALSLLSACPVPVLWVVGNNDLEAMNTTALSNYPARAHELARYHGQGRISVLDCTSLTWGRPPALVGFAGSYAGYDGSLYRPAGDSKARALMAELEAIHRQYGLDCSPLDLFRSCQRRLKQDLWALPTFLPKVVCTHTVPDERLLLYRKSARHDDLNVAMGWDDTWLHEVPGLRLQLCAHTHRHQVVEREGAPPLVNISGGGFHLFTIEPYAGP